MYFSFHGHMGKKGFKRFPLIVTMCCTNLSPLLLPNPSCVFVCLPVLTEYLGGDVLPVEQHAASDLSSLLHANSHLEALMERDAPHCVHVAFSLTETCYFNSTDKLKFLFVCCCFLYFFQEKRGREVEFLWNSTQLPLTF